MTKDVLKTGNQIYQQIVKISKTIDCLNTAINTGKDMELHINVQEYAPAASWIPSDLAEPILALCEAKRSEFEEQFNALQTEENETE